MSIRPKYLFIDLETTGVDVEKHGVWQFAAIPVVGGSPGELFKIEFAPLPWQEVDPGAAKAHGKSEEELRAMQDPRLAKPKIERFLSGIVNKFDKKDKCFFTGYNSTFDYRFLRKWWENMGDQWFGSWFWTPPVDMMTCAALMLASRRDEMPNFKLGTVLERLGINVAGELHDAGVDITGTMQIWNVFREWKVNLS